MRRAAGVEIFPDPQALARGAADRVAEAAARAIEARGRFRIGLSGGRSPEGLYRELARPEERGGDRVAPAFTGGAAGKRLAGRASLEWSRVEVLFADERAAPPTEPESNYWMVRKLLVEPAGVPPGNVHRMRADAEDLEAAAAEYEGLLEAPLDLLVLGVGEDGHIASIFPGSPLVRERQRRVAAVHDSPKSPRRRLTVTPRAIAEAHGVLVLATGTGKAEAVARALEGDEAPDRVPARLLRGATWCLDREAAARLRE